MARRSDKNIYSTARFVEMIVSVGKIPHQPTMCIVCRKSFLKILKYLAINALQESLVDQCEKTSICGIDIYLDEEYLKTNFKGCDAAAISKDEYLQHYKNTI